MNCKAVILENRYFFIPALIRDYVDTQAASKILLFEILKHRIEQSLKEGLNERNS